jgi:hypothetical protein
MTSIRTVPVHEVVRQTYPRPPREGDELAMAVGRAIDSTLSRVGHEARVGRRWSASAARSLAETLLDEEVAAAAVDLPPAERAKLLARIDSVVRAFRASELFGLDRPRTRVILVNGDVGIYAQPDYWDGRGRIFEMKSYPAVPPPPDVALQLRLFQLAFPGLACSLVCLNRHVDPVERLRLDLAPPTAEETTDALRTAYAVARAHGEPKVLEYVAGPFVAYTVPTD